MQLQYTIAGINYVLIEIPLITTKSAEKLKWIIRKYNCIEQAAIIDRGILSNIVTVRLLVPEENIMAFQNDPILES